MSSKRRKTPQEDRVAQPSAHAMPDFNPPQIENGLYELWQGGAKPVGFVVVHAVGGLSVEHWLLVSAATAKFDTFTPPNPNKNVSIEFRPSADLSPTVIDAIERLGAGTKYSYIVATCMAMR